MLPLTPGEPAQTLVGNVPGLGAERDRQVGVAAPRVGEEHGVAALFEHSQHTRVRETLRAAATQNQTLLRVQLQKERLMSFLVHDLKNLVAQMSLMLKNAERHRHNPRFQGENFAKNLELAAQVQEMAREKGCTASQLALAWVLAQPEVRLAHDDAGHLL